MKYSMLILMVAEMLALSSCGKTSEMTGFASTTKNDHAVIESMSSEKTEHESDASTEAEEASTERIASEGTADEPMTAQVDQDYTGTPDAEDSGVETVDEIDTEDDRKITEIEISFDFSRMSTKASNQTAAWVEDENGNVIKTLYVSDFTGRRRGYEKREDAVPHWVAAAEPESMTDEEIDAISGATLQTGDQIQLWDLTDNTGNPVPDGQYTVKLEGTLFWSSNVVYSGTVDIGADQPGDIEVSEERSEPDNQDNETMILNVKMTAKS